MASSIIQELINLATKPAAQTASEISAAAEPRDTTAMLRNLLTPPSPAPAYNAPEMTVPGDNGFVLPPLDNAEMRSGNLPTWAEVPGQFIRNLAPQTVEMAQAAAPFAEALASPIGTGRAIAQRYVTGQDAGTNREQDAELAKIVLGEIAKDPLGLGYLRDTYGTAAGLKKQLAENPAWAIFDASLFVPGSAEGSAAMRAGTTAGKVAAKDATKGAFTRALETVPPKPEPLALERQRIMAAQSNDRAMNEARRPEMNLGSASVDPNEALAFKRPQVPHWKALERNFGVLNFEGTPTAATTTGDLTNEGLRQHIRDLRDRRFGNSEKGIKPATNKFDRAYYDRKISEAQDAMVTPSPDFDAEFPVRWERDKFNTSFPFRYSRITEMHPDEIGMSPPGVFPGRWTLTDGRKDWRWERDATPSTPDTVQREQMLGDTEAAQHAGHWEPQDPEEWGQRGWQWVQDTFNTRPGTTTAAHNAEMEAAVARGALGDTAALGGAGFERYLPFTELPDQFPPLHAGEIPSGAFYNTFQEQGHLNAKLDAADINPALRERLKAEAIARRPDRHQAMREAIALEPLDAARQGNLGIPDPRFHPDPNAAWWGQPIPPTPEFTPNPFDPAHQRRDINNMSDAQLVAALRQPDHQLGLFGLHNFKSPWEPASRDAFKTQAPNIKWDAVPNTRLGRDTSGINQSYKLDLDGVPFFRKETTSFGNTGTEVAALEAGDIMGASVLPVYRDGHNSMVTPWIEGATIHRARGDAGDIIQGMSPGARTRQTIYEWLMADTDKHGNNYFVDTKGNKIVGIDYGGALMGDEFTMFNNNAFYNVLKENMNYADVKLQVNEMSAILEKQAQIAQAFDNNGVDRRDLGGLLYRFKLLKDFLDEYAGREPSLRDFELFMTSRRGRR